MIPNIFITSDHHFGSWKNKLSLMRVFNEFQENKLISKWNNLVKFNDIVIYNGDFHDCNVKDLIEYRQKLNGKIILVKGNHDILTDDVYNAIFEKTVESLDCKDFIVHHQPDSSKCFQIYGHVHRTNEKPSIDGFCSCVQYHNGYPILIEDAISNDKFVRQIRNQCTSLLTTLNKC